MLRISLLPLILIPVLPAATAAENPGANLTPLRPTHTEPGPRPASILWVGNSFFYFNNSLHNHFNRLAASAVPAVRVRGTSVTISGAGLDWHDLASLVRENGLGRYSFVGDNELRFNPPGRQYDTCVMMDCSQCVTHPRLQEAFHQAVRRHVQTLGAAGIRPVLFMSWAYQDRPDMTAAVAAEYIRAANDHHLLVIPVGLAFARALAQRPGTILHDPDKRHPSLAGTYLAAATSYAALFRQSPEPLTYTAGLEPELAAFLRRVARETVEEFFRR
ncbi:MAG: hypothetical protein HZC55_05950 [Verrucomicrobia bacterium]|nr:hypothetical protein [Verrucomicrobiota bacterium]